MRVRSLAWVGVLSLAGLVACGSDPAGETSDEFGPATDTDGSEAEPETGPDSGPDSGDQEGGSGSGEEGGGGSACGNGEVDQDEECDGSDFDGRDCGDFGFVTGELSCTPNCKLDATACLNQLCGNGVVEGDEDCDGTELGGVECSDLGFSVGLPVCGDDCVFDTSGCDEGKSCGLLSPCGNNLSCVSGVCYDGSSGDPCDFNSNCQSNNCVGATLLQDGACA